MTTMKRRYNAEIQRAKGLLELAAAVYDTSLSFQTTRAAEQVLQTDSRVGYSLKLSLTTRRSQHENGVSLSFAADGFRELRAVAEGKISLAWINPSVAATLAFKGKGPFSRPLPIRTLAVFPSYDVVGFAVRASTGVTSLAEIRQKKIPLRLSTGQTIRAVRLVAARSDDVHGDGGHEGRWLYPGRHQEVGREDSVGIETEPSGPARGHRERDDRRRLRRRDQKLGADGRRSRLPLPACGGADPRAPDGDGLSPVRSAEVQISKYGRRRQHGGFQWLAHDRSRGHAGRGGLRALPSDRSAQGFDSYGQLQAGEGGAALRR